jgi:hypothetical protein
MDVEIILIDPLQEEGTLLLYAMKLDEITTAEYKFTT